MDIFPSTPPLKVDRLQAIVNPWNEFFRRCDNPGGVSDIEVKRKALELFISEKRNDVMRTWDDFLTVAGVEPNPMNWDDLRNIFKNN